MSVYRPRIIATLCLLLSVGAVAAVMILLRPAPADAAGNSSRQFLFGPVLVPPATSGNFVFVNTGTRPTPPATVVFLNAVGGEVLESKPFESMPPGGANSATVFGPDRHVLLVVTFDRPAAGQAIPTPFAGTLQVGAIGGLKEVVYPNR
jgi:hypothetical protein